ncbi:MAG: hypothetical protein R3B59_08065 [Dehalococcoidia bacterium]
MLHYLREGRRALLSHPLVDADVAEATGAYCRLAIVAVVSAFEISLDAWAVQGRATGEIKGAMRKAITLRKFLATDGPEEAAEKVHRVLQEWGASPDLRVIQQYIALKHLRDRIVHGEPNAQNLDSQPTLNRFTTSLGLPSDPSARETFTEMHWEMVFETYWSLRHYLYTAGLTGSEGAFTQTVGRAMASTPPTSPRGNRPPLIAPSDLPRLWQFNIERVTARIRERQSIGLPLVADDQADARLALESWQQYRMLRLPPAVIDEQVVSLQLERIRRFTGKEGTPFDEETLLIAERLIENLAALSVAAEFLSILGPAADPDGRSEYQRERTFTLDAFEFAHRFNMLVEGSVPNPVILTRISDWRTVG